MRRCSFTVWTPKRGWLLAPLLALFAAGVPAPLLAHPLGNFSINRYSHLEVGAAQIDLFYVVDMAEIPTHRARQAMDRDSNQVIDDDERQTYGIALARMVNAALELKLDGQPLLLTPQQETVIFQPGQAGLETLRIEVIFSAALPPASGTRQLQYTDRAFDGHTGWQESILTAATGVQLLSSDVPAVDTSDALRHYPTELLQSPLATGHAQATFDVQGNGTWLRTFVPAAIPAPTLAGKGTGKATDPFTELITIPALEPWTLILALLAAFGWGAIHAMSPGHGKTIVGAYLVGTRGTVRHAILLGVTTTITHTIGVFALGVGALAASEFILPEQLYPWLGLGSGLLVVAIGCSRLHAWWQSQSHHHAMAPHTHGDHVHHDHTHSDHTHSDHTHPRGLYAHDHGDGHLHSHLPVTTEDTAVTWRTLLALGISGGLLPCPSALVVMLGSIALGRITFGLMLIVVFSLGLASVLTAIGVALVHAAKLFERIPEQVQITRWLPAGSALFITAAGLVITLQTLATTGLFTH